ncbi:MAG: flavin reductase family protein [Pseudomonadota bacterium]
MRAVANTVTVVTTEGPAGRHGATVSAFCSVSADPPSVLVCLHAESRIARLVKHNGSFAVNALAADQPDLALRFAGGDDATLRSVQGCETGACDRFDAVALDPLASQPSLHGALVFSCRVQQCQQVGSHEVVVAEVVGVSGSVDDPLVYRDGGFVRVVSDEESGRRG